MKISKFATKTDLNWIMIEFLPQIWFLITSLLFIIIFPWFLFYNFPCLFLSPLSALVEGGSCCQITITNSHFICFTFTFLIFDQLGWDLFDLGFMCSQVCEAFAKIGWCSPNTISSPRKHSVGRWWKLEVNRVQFYLPSAWKVLVENQRV